MESIKDRVERCKTQLGGLVKDGRMPRVIQSRVGDQLASLRIWQDKVARLSDRQQQPLEHKLGVGSSGIGRLLPALQMLELDIKKCEYLAKNATQANRGSSPYHGIKPEHRSMKQRHRGLKHRQNEVRNTKRTDAEQAVLDSLECIREDLQRLNKALHRLQNDLMTTTVKLDARLIEASDSEVRALVRSASGHDWESRQDRAQDSIWVTSDSQQRPERDEMIWLHQRFEDTCADRNRRLAEMLQANEFRDDIATTRLRSRLSEQASRGCLRHANRFWTFSNADRAVVMENLMMGNMQTRYPRSGVNEFGCPFCGTCFKVGQVQGAWQDHIMAHLQPFVCLFPECDSAQVTYSTFDAWTAHMFDLHGSESRYTCPLEGCADEYGNHAPLASHFVDAHKLNGRRDELIFAAKRRIQKMLPLERCDLCTGHSTQPGQSALLEHIAEHMRWYAMLSVLPLPVPELDIVRVSESRTQPRRSVRFREWSGSSNSTSSSAGSTSSQVEAALKIWPQVSDRSVLTSTCGRESLQMPLTEEPGELDSWPTTVTPLFVQAGGVRRPY